MAVGKEELGTRRCHIEVVNQMGADLCAVIELTVHIERERAVDGGVVLIEITPHCEVATGT